VTESVKARAQTGMAKNSTMRIMIIRSENLFLFMTHAHPFSLFFRAFPVPKKQEKGKESPKSPIS
jgi:hypothetical protein